MRSRGRGAAPTSSTRDDVLARLVIPGAPRTKKNSLRRIKRGKRTFVVSSGAHSAWAERAAWVLKAAWHGQAIACDVEVTALVYREADWQADLVGYLQAIGDMLAPHDPAAHRVLVNDRQIKSWDGSRAFVDRANPRVELTIRTFAG